MDGLLDTKGTSFFEQERHAQLHRLDAQINVHANGNQVHTQSRHAACVERSHERRSGDILLLATLIVTLVNSHSPSSLNHGSESADQPGGRVGAPLVKKHLAVLSQQVSASMSYHMLQKLFIAHIHLNGTVLYGWKPLNGLDKSDIIRDEHRSEVVSTLQTRHEVVVAATDVIVIVRSVGAITHWTCLSTLLALALLLSLTRQCVTITTIIGCTTHVFFFLSLLLFLLLFLLFVLFLLLILLLNGLVNQRILSRVIHIPHPLAICRSLRSNTISPCSQCMDRDK